MVLCKHDEFCGGCIYQGVDYAEQLKIKEETVIGYLKANEVNVKHFDSIKGCDNQFEYRNKMEYTFGDWVKDGEMTLGMHKKGNFMSIVTVDECQLVDSDFNKILRFVLDFAVSMGYKHYNKKSHLGLLRNLIVRKGVRTKELLINIVTTSEPGFDEDGFCKGIIDLKLDNTVVGILRTYNDNIADTVKCEKLKALYGRDYYNEEIMGLKFKVSAFSFFQTNVEAVERLYSEAIDLIDSIDGKVAFDLYCGAGTISQVLALKAKKVIGIEIVDEAVEAAKENARYNGLDNCEFISGDVLKVIKSIEDKPDIIVVDPPRVGIHPKALDSILGFGVKQIVYISCNPKTMAMNLKYMEYYGYDIEYLKCFDNFPNTKHVETVCLLSRKDK